MHVAGPLIPHTSAFEVAIALWRVWKLQIIRYWSNSSRNYRRFIKIVKLMQKLQCIWCFNN